MAREEVKRSLHFMLKVVMVDVTGDASVTTVAAEEVATAEEAMVEVEVEAAGGQNPILTLDPTLIRSGCFLATIRRESYFLSVIKFKREISMRSRYRKRQSLTSPRLRPDRTLVWQPKRRKRFLVTVLPARIVAVHEDVALWCLVQGLLEKSIMWINNRNAQRSDSSTTPTRILVMWGKAVTSNTIWVVNVLLIPFLIRLKDKMY